ncbi:18180_t:CDS:2 [Rhizophagus irregularis]|nr:18180_t:CDS:2 [Rhizophagus irregularis]
MVDGLEEKERNLHKEVLHPAIEPEEVEEPDEVSKAQTVFAKGEYTEEFDRKCRSLVPSFTPYNSNMIPMKEAVEEFDANNKRMKERLEKEDKTKRVNSETEMTVTRPQKVKRK